jgi:hypothetical protein
VSADSSWVELAVDAIFCFVAVEDTDVIHTVCDLESASQYVLQEVQGSGTSRPPMRGGQGSPILTLLILPNFLTWKLSPDQINTQPQ